MPWSYISTKKAKESISKIYSEASSDIDIYKNEFDSEVQRLSLLYTESTPVTKVASLITKHFIECIDAADKRSHIKKLSISYYFYVMSNRIEYSKDHSRFPLGRGMTYDYDRYGCYDFEIERCANLTLVGQAAVAKAIVSIVQQQIAANYFSHVHATVNNSYNISQSGVYVIISFTEPNCNYRPTQSW